jgi:hypothetical protein
MNCQTFDIFIMYNRLQYLLFFYPYTFELIFCFIQYTGIKCFFALGRETKEI